MQRICAGSMPKALASAGRSAMGFWCEQSSSIRPSPNGRATALRGSIGIAATRDTGVLSRTWCLHWAIACPAASQSPRCQSTQRLPGRSSCTSGASGARASSSVVTAPSSSSSTATASAASCAWAAVSASTTASGSPRWRTRSTGISGRGVASQSRPSGPRTFMSTCTGPMPSPARSAPVSTATTPGMSRASEISSATIRAEARSARTKAATSAGPAVSSP